jgi:hypothetical protein
LVIVVLTVGVLACHQAMSSRSKNARKYEDFCFWNSNMGDCREGRENTYTYVYARKSLNPFHSKYEIPYEKYTCQPTCETHVVHMWNTYVVHMWNTCVHMCNWNNHMWFTYDIHVIHMWVFTCDSDVFQFTCGSHVNHMRITCDCSNSTCTCEPHVFHMCIFHKGCFTFIHVIV